MDYRIKRILLKPFDLLYKLNPELELKLMYRIKTGEKLRLDSPLTYNEKLQWLKLYYKDNRIPKLVDKYTVRKFVQNRELSHILNTVLWQGFDPKNIPFNTLPEKFVIKVTHGQGFNIICTDKSEIEKERVLTKLDKWLNTKFLPSYGEWFYGVEKPRIIVEEFLAGSRGSVPEDYKVFCFDGKPKYIVVDTDRFNGHKRNVYDLEWNLMENYQVGFPNDEQTTKKPIKLDQMLEYASVLSKGFPHVRVDFYIVDNQIRFGEMSFTNNAGFGYIYPEEFNIELGSYINLVDL